MNRNVLRKALAVTLFAIGMGTTFTALAQKAAIVQGEGDRTANIVIRSFAIGQVSGVDTIYTVPAGMVFVLETISLEIAEAQVNTGRSLVIQTSLGFNSGYLYLRPQTTPELINGTYFSSGIFHVSVRYPPGTVIQATFATFGPGNAAVDAAYVHFFGHLEPQ
jgi:hypothetical protein